ncbi:NAD(P)H-dependent oxidoreductase [Chitinophaga polysaccharea]|uniref:NADPH-dependent FMN reductase n=1 Tax=Chitinophaga TaxID=79328 RepID=UPI00145583CA|nr:MULTISPECIES: NADPH-dependent FMN reductase [Chitinophaga]NLR58385.1 NAD(P)H-dependent oxidoreductase [Chitinophaga polysaccharea]NLU90912.1 NAD(P)H-dependent oxidoreductase [Chitinophaga sp. Ak27]
MTNKIKVLAICGSTRQSSSNHNIIKAFTALSSDIFDVRLYDGLTHLPHFNPDEDLAPDDAPAAVQDFRRQLELADAVLISTPEYAIGVPGTLKNAIDWTVSSMHFSKKPVALITAGTSGHKAHQSLLGTLLIIESRISEDTQVVVSSVRTKVNDQGVITDEVTLTAVRKLIQSLAGLTDGSVTACLPPPSLF